MGCKNTDISFENWINENKPKSNVNTINIIIQQIIAHIETMENPPPIELIINILFSTNFHQTP